MVDSDNNRFEIVFKMRDQILAEEAGPQPHVRVVYTNAQAELDELAELRRMSLEISEPQQTYSTTT